MKIFLTVLVSFCLMAEFVYGEEKAVLKDQKEKLSYSMGADFGMKLQGQALDIDPGSFARGMTDAVTGADLLLSKEEMQEILNDLRKELIAKQTEKLKLLAEKNKKEGEAFLAENKKKEGVVTLPSGLQYKVIKEGAGKTPSETDSVTTNYRGKLIDGTEFDSSYKRGKPTTFPVKGVIPAWIEALQLMKEGAQWTLFVPPDLAYGEKGAGNVIGPNATLIFDVELIEIKQSE